MEFFANDTEKGFIARFMSDKSAVLDFPADNQRAAVAYSIWRARHVKNSAPADATPKAFKSRFILPGLVNYPEKEAWKMGLIQKPTLDKMLGSFIGSPVVDVTHKPIPSPLPENWFRENADGVVSKAWFNEADGWYWCEFLVWTPETKEHCDSETFGVSCAYDILEANAGGEHNKIPFDIEIIDGKYTHLAIVQNPRYEGVGRIDRVVYNSTDNQGGSLMNLLEIFKGKDGKEVKNSFEGDLSAQTVDVDGKQVSLKELIDVFKAEEAEKAKSAEVGAKNALTDETEFEIDGKKTTLKNMCDSYRAKNAASAKEEEKKPEEKPEEKKADNAEKPAEEKPEEKEEPIEKAENSAPAVHQGLKQAAEMRGGVHQPKIEGGREAALRGKAAFGSTKK